MYKYKFELHLLFHFFLGAICALFPNLVIIWTLYIVFVQGVLKTLRYKNKNGNSHKIAAYVAALELIVRMSNVGLPHELTKYAVSLILLCGVFYDLSSRKWPSLIIIYFAIQLVSIPMLIDIGDIERIRQLISFNLSGPFCLMIAVVYFYKRHLSLDDLKRMFKNILLPISATIGWLYVDTPSILEVNFGLTSNFATSGYGPNQMAALLALGLLVILLTNFMNISLFSSYLFKYGMLGLVLFRSVITFSRGGLYSALVAVSLLFIYHVFNLRASIFKKIRSVLYFSTTLVVAFYVISYINVVSGGMLTKRFAGPFAGQQVKLNDFSSGRVDLARIDFNIFLDHPFWGVGPGGATTLRYEYGYDVKRVVAHTEFSRLVAEHGVWGIFAIIILIYFPFTEFFKTTSLSRRYIIIAFSAFLFSYMLHSATRIALPLLLFGLSFAHIYENNPLHRQPPLPPRGLSQRRREHGTPLPA